MKLKELISIISISMSFVFLSSCNNHIIKKGIYQNKYGEIVKFDGVKQFEFYSHSLQKVTYSSGIYQQEGKNTILITDSANLPYIENVSLKEKNNGERKVEFHIDDSNFRKKSDNTINYKIFINDTLAFNLLDDNSVTLKNIENLDRIRIGIFFDTTNILGPRINTPIYTNSYKLINRGEGIFFVKLKVHSKMFHIEFFKTAVRVNKNSIYFNKKAVFLYCSKCEWQKSVMESPAMIK
jgi:hypothetical protein